MTDRDPRLQASEALAAIWQSEKHTSWSWQQIIGTALDALYAAAGGDVIVTRPVCGTCGGNGHRDVEYNLCQTEARTAESAAAIADIMHAAARKLAPCPDCVDGKLPTEVKSFPTDAIRVLHQAVADGEIWCSKPVNRALQALWEMR
jgi:hypothetical protein